jgi:hypothetical protein
MSKFAGLMGYGVVALLTAGFTSVPTGVPESVRQKYAHLYKLTTQKNADGSVSFHNGRLFKRDGLNILFLKGDRFEMAYQHGKLLADDIKTGALPQAHKMFERQIRNGIPQIFAITPLILRHFLKKYPESFLKSALSNGAATSTSMINEAYGLSEGSGRPLEEILYAAVNPESLQIMVGERLSGEATALGPIVGPTSSCSAFVAWGKSTADGEILIGRNTDYPLNGSYDRHPTVMYFSPTDGTQKYQAVTSAGLHTAGVVGINESGIYIGVHTIPSVAVSTSGLPTFASAQEVLRKARNFDEAVELFQKVKSGAGWTYLLVSTKEKKAASVEISNRGVSILPVSSDHHGQTNHYRTAARAAEYLHINLSVDDDSIGRLKRVEDLLDENVGRLDVPAAMAILGDKYDPFYRKVRGIGNVVAVHTTMTSVVVQPKDQSVWVASGRAPVSISTYVKLPMVAVADADAFSKAASILQPNVDYAVKNPAESEAEQHFIRGKMAYETDLDPVTGLIWMDKAVKADPGNPAYGFVAGILALRSSNFAAASRYFGDLTNQSNDHYRRLGHYYLARMYAHSGDESPAREHFRAAAFNADTKRERKLLVAIQDGAEKLKRLRRFKINTDMLTLMVQQADMVEY